MAGGSSGSSGAPSALILCLAYLEKPQQNRTSGKTRILLLQSRCEGINFPIDPQGIVKAEAAGTDTIDYGAITEARRDLGVCAALFDFKFKSLPLARHWISTMPWRGGLPPILVNEYPIVASPKVGLPALYLGGRA